MACYREAFVQASNLAFLWIFTGLWKEVWKTLSRFILLQKGTDSLGPEGICTWRHPSQQRVILSILQTELFQICSCLGELHPTELSLQTELLNHFFHSCNTGWTRHGVLKKMADLRATCLSLTSLSVIMSSSIHIAANDIISLFLWLSSIPLHTISYLSIYLGCLLVFTIVNGAAMNIEVHVSFQIGVFSRYMSRSGIAGSCGNSIFTF